MQPLQFDPLAARDLVNKLVAGAEACVPPAVNITSQIAATPGVGGFGMALISAAEKTGKEMASVCNIALDIAASSQRSLEDIEHHDEDLAHALEVAL
ncbi:hypothetical protein [Corynebacterium glucuronolyticum]|uniref:hypothetical protein n=1 Tax=Corynebacterium glucuronolyticum TaxID=39791 RepID=UPI00223B5119|nr:hypothetical protein [Corynebacterium glucuronolyticum]MCT1563589.1 hypothetical protein [Corynebacterium glucuronolyticum]